jgi:hypothetical protein
MKSATEPLAVASLLLVADTRLVERRRARVRDRESIGVSPHPSLIHQRLTP